MILSVAVSALGLASMAVAYPPYVPPHVATYTGLNDKVVSLNVKKGDAKTIANTLTEFYGQDKANCVADPNKANTVNCQMKDPKAFSWFNEYQISCPTGPFDCQVDQALDRKGQPSYFRTSTFYLKTKFFTPYLTVFSGPSLEKVVEEINSFEKAKCQTKNYVNFECSAMPANVLRQRVSCRYDTARDDVPRACNVMQYYQSSRIFQ